MPKLCKFGKGVFKKMKDHVKRLSIFFALLVFLGPVTWVSADQSLTEFLYLKNGTKIKCDAVWKGMGDFIWCSKSHNVKGYPAADVDITKTFLLQPHINKRLQKSLSCFRSEDWDSAIASASEALLLDPDNEFALTNRAGAYDMKGLFRKAIEDCNKAIKINPRYGLAYNNRGFALEMLGESYHAGTDYETSCRLGCELGCKNYERLVVNRKSFDTKPLVEKYLDRSLESFQKGEWDRAISAASSALSFDPQNFVAYTNRAAAYCKKGMLMKALDDCNSAIRIKPDFALARNNRGYALELMGERNAALVEYDKSCKMGSELGCENYKRLAGEK